MAVVRATSPVDVGTEVVPLEELPVVLAPVSNTLPPMTFRAESVVPPITVPSHAMMPVKLPRAAVPVMSVPIRFP